MSSFGPDWMHSIDDWGIDSTCEALDGFLGQINRFFTDAHNNLDKKIEEFKQDHGGVLPDEVDFSDDAFSIELVRRAMLGGLAVGIASLGEQHRESCLAKLKSGGADTRTAYAQLATVPGYVCYNRARLLGNCFKHNDNAVSGDLVAAFPGQYTAGETLELGNEDWKTMIAETATFAKALLRLV